MMARLTVFAQIMGLGGIFIAFIATMLPASADGAESMQNRANGPTAINFNIPSQPLEDALYAFGATTGISILVDGRDVVGRRSTAVTGPFTSSQAIRTLLTGTGLDVRQMKGGAITLSRANENKDQFRAYSTALQNAVLAQLCKDSELHLGTFRLALQLWLDDMGRVRRIALLSSTGDSARDRRIQERLASISTEAPPLGLPQPIGMVILPRPPRDSGDCT
ncbi:STN domain-containing protein [Microbacteriaceae bacterium K1510]|nr:STN domain-containing protein [Microbacteriaceae bacterium K1510]